MNWFEGVFLPSLEDRYNQRNGKMWLTEKQTDVCRNYMEYSRYIRGAMDYVIGEKRFHIQIAPNGCAALHITLDGAEFRQVNG